MAKFIKIESLVTLGSYFEKGKIYEADEKTASDLIKLKRAKLPTDKKAKK